MKLFRKCFSAAIVCLLSFFKRGFKARRRIICAVCALAVVLSVMPLSIMSAGVEASSELFERSIEITPDDARSDVTITLNGMMPGDAAAEATNVTDDMDEPADDASILSAYDISINHAAGEFQPAEGYPIFVEISDPVIADSDSIAVIHIADDGTSESVKHFTVESTRSLRSTTAVRQPQWSKTSMSLQIRKARF